MKSLTLLLTVVAVLAALCSAALFLVIGNSKERLARELDAALTRAEALSGDLAEATARGDGLRRQVNALDADLGDTKTRLTAAETRVAQLSRDLNQTRGQLTAQEAEALSLNRELADAKRELVQSRLSAAQGASPEEVAEYRRLITQLEDQVAGLQRAAGARGPAADEGTARFTAQRALNARVVTVGPRDAFVVLNYGANHGAALQQELLLRRGSENLARVQISDVRENHSVAQVLPASLQGSLRRGDAAMLLQ
jgi:uncharacterized protein YoxC